MHNSEDSQRLHKTPKTPNPETLNSISSGTPGILGIYDECEEDSRLLQVQKLV